MGSLTEAEPCRFFPRLVVSSPHDPLSPSLAPALGYRPALLSAFYVDAGGVKSQILLPAAASAFATEPFPKHEIIIFFVVLSL